MRRVCSHCREERKIPAAERQVYEREVGETRTLFEYGAGCNHCAGTGYRGRVAVFELLVLNDEVRRLVLRNANSDDVQAAALEAGMRTMLKDGMLKAKMGMTTPTEVLKNVFALH